MEVGCAIKKNPGKLVEESGQIRWIPAAGGNPETLSLADIQGMQATPPTATKLRIKLSAKDGRSLMLEFAGASELERARNDLQALIKSYREQGGSGTPKSQPESAPGSLSPQKQPQTSGNATSSKKTAKKISLDPAKLLQNLDLQRSLLRQDPELMRTFQQVVISSGALTNEQFWSLRIQLLVTAAQQQLQVRGSYNVLSTIKPSIGSDNQVNINLTREKIADVFDQYPLVRKAYNDNVPKLSEGEFWQRFFMSKLFLVLRGEKVAQNHPLDAIFDPYIDILYESQEKQRARRAAEDSEHPVPLFIDVEGNAENNPETYGNDITTTAGKGTRGLIRSMNGLSQRLLLGKRKQKDAFDDLQPAGPEAMESELRLNDLANSSSNEHEIGLHLKLGNSETSNISSEDVIKLREEFCKQIPSSISFDPVLESIHDGTSQCEQLINSLTPHKDATQVNPNMVVSNEAQLTQATSLEFLKHFWNAYGKNPSEAAHLRDYLIKSQERISAVELEAKGSLQPLSDAIRCALSMSL